MITFEASPLVRRYLEETEITWPILIDHGRKLYRAYGMLHMPLWRAWGPASAWAYAKEAFRGHLPRIPHGDTSQQGGDVLVDPRGVVRLLHVGGDPADRPPVELLLDVIRQRSTHGQR